MKTAEIFWNVIADYNQSTIVITIAASAVTIALLLYGHYRQNLAVARMLKAWFALQSLYVAAVFFLVFDGSKTALILGAPFFTAIALLLLYDSCNTAVIRKANIPEIVLYLIVTLYPLFSLVLGRLYPRLVFPLMPCPLVSYILLTYVRFDKRLIILEVLLLLWAATGLPKAFIFNVPEDGILFLAGLYYLLRRYIGHRNKEYGKPLSETEGYEK